MITLNEKPHKCIFSKPQQAATYVTGLSRLRHVTGPQVQSESRVVRTSSTQNMSLYGPLTSRT